MPVCPRCGHSDVTLGAACPEHPTLRLVCDEASAEARRDPLLGRCISDRFAVVGVAGEGGIGRVYRAVDEHSLERRSVALKVLKRSHVEDAVVRGRFEREARIMGALSHPNLVGLYAQGALEDGRHYIAMEFVQGAGLDEVIARGDAARLVPGALVGLLLGVAGGLAEAHRAQVTHRDLKPSNVLLVAGASGAESVKVVDFGIARAEPGQSTLTKTGMLFGTPAYMSPEQAMGDSDIGPAVDVYAFGVMLYELLCGRRPFEGEQALVLLMAHVNQAPPPLTVREGLEPLSELAGLALRCLSKSASARPADGAALVEELEDIARRAGVVPLAPLSAGALLGTLRASASDANTTTASSLRAPAVVADDARRRTLVVGIAAAAIVVLGVVIGSVIALSGSDGGSGTRGEAVAQAQTLPPQAGDAPEPESVALAETAVQPAPAHETPAAAPITEPTPPLALDHDDGALSEPPPSEPEPDYDFDTSIPGTSSASDEWPFSTSVPGTDDTDDLPFDTSIPGTDASDTASPVVSSPKSSTRKDPKHTKPKKKPHADHEREKREAEKRREDQKRAEEREREKQKKDAERLRKEAEKRQKQIGNQIGKELEKRLGR